MKTELMRRLKMVHPVIQAPLAGGGVFVSNGDFYATTVVERLGLAAHGLVRAGCACYTTEEEIGRLLEAMEQIAARRG